MNDKWGHGDKFEKFDASRMDNGQPFDIGWGEHPHSRSDNRAYARLADGSIEGFDGHRIRTHVELRTFNYLKCSGLSGNEVRKGGQFRIYLNDRLVWAEFVREADYGLLCAHRRLGELMDHSIQIWRPEEPEIGRPVFYRDEPAVIESFHADQNDGSGHRLILRADGIERFRRPPWDDDGDYERDRVVTNILDPGIWWWREAKRKERDR